LLFRSSKGGKEEEDGGGGGGGDIIIFVNCSGIIKDDAFFVVCMILSNGDRCNREANEL
jgi:hypothetical protein